MTLSSCWNKAHLLGNDIAGLVVLVIDSDNEVSSTVSTLQVSESEAPVTFSHVPWYFRRRLLCPDSSD